MLKIKFNINEFTIIFSEEIRRKINAENISRLSPPSSASIFQFQHLCLSVSALSVFCFSPSAPLFFFLFLSSSAPLFFLPFLFWFSASFFLPSVHVLPFFQPKNIFFRPKQFSFSAQNLFQFNPKHFSFAASRLFI